MNNATLIMIGGPTASGKTKLAIEVAKHFNTEIISADSRQCFKEMNIGTAKPNQEELTSVPHHFIDCLSVSEEVNAGVFCDYANNKIEELSKSKKYIVITGGTGLYMKALLEGLDDLPFIPEAFRNELKLEFLNKGLPYFANELKQKDSSYYNTVDLNNPARVIRAIELIRFTGKPYSSLIKKKSEEKKHNSINLFIDLPREELYSRINNRVDLMFNNGLIREVESLKKFRFKSSLQTVGYNEVFDFFDGKNPLDKTIDLVKQHTRNYAKRQVTWFKNQGEFKSINNQLQSVLSLIQ